MRIGFISFGLSFSLGIISEYNLNKCGKLAMFGYLRYALSIFMSAFFSTNYPGLDYAEKAVYLHSIFASLAGFSLIIAMLVDLKGQSDNLKKVITVFIILISLSSLMFQLFESYQGLIQRLLYLISFTYFFIRFNNKREKV